MKDALAYFGLRFSDMDLVAVSVSGDVMTFSHGGKIVTVIIPLK